jgi:hypothetical protein
MAQALILAASVTSNMMIGMAMMVPANSSTMSDAAKPTSSFAFIASFTSSGAPPALATMSSPVAYGVSSGKTLSSSCASTGTKTKFVTIAMATPRMSRSGRARSPIV